MSLAGGSQRGLADYTELFGRVLVDNKMSTNYRGLKLTMKLGQVSLTYFVTNVCIVFIQAHNGIYGNSMSG
jgi:hypothetical protein